MSEKDEVKKSEAKMQLMEMIVHASDFALSTRQFKTVKKGTYLLFEEFF